MTLWYLQPYLEAGLKKNNLMIRALLFMFAATALLESVVGIKILLHVVLELFTWKPLHFTINVKEVPVSSCVCVDMCERRRTTKVLSLEINYRVMQREGDMPRNAEPRVTFCLLSLSQTAEAQRRKRFILKPFEADQAIYNRWNADLLLQRT